MEDIREKYLSDLNFRLQKYIATHGIANIETLKTPKNFIQLSIRVSATSNPNWVTIDIADTTVDNKLEYVSNETYSRQNPNAHLTRTACATAKKLFGICSDFFKENGYKLGRIVFSIAIHKNIGLLLFLKWPSVFTSTIVDIETGNKLLLDEVGDHEYKKSDEYHQLEEQLKAAGAFAYWTGNSN